MEINTPYLVPGILPPHGVPRFEGPSRINPEALGGRPEQLTSDVGSLFGSGPMGKGFELAQSTPVSPQILSRGRWSNRWHGNGN